MGEHRNIVAKRFVDEDLARGVREVVVATDNVRDVHECIVADHGEVIGGRAIGAHQDHVVHHVCREAHVAIDRIIEFDRTMTERYFQAPNMGLSCIDARLCLFGREAAAGAVVARIAAFGRFGGSTFLVELLLCAEARVDHATFFQALERICVGVETLGLKVRAMVAAYFGAFVPVEAEPAHRAQDDLLVLFGGALGVGVLDAQDEIAIVSTCECPVINGCARAADVELSGRRGSETDAYGFLRSSHRYPFKLSKGEVPVFYNARA